MSKYLNLESVNSEALPVQAFIQHIHGSRLYYVLIPAKVESITLSVLREHMLDQLSDDKAAMVEDFINMQKDNDDVEVTDDTEVMGTDGTDTVLHFSIIDTKR